MFIPYTNQTTLKNIALLGNLARPAGTGVGRNDVTRNIIFDNVRAGGLSVGVRVPVQGNNVVQDGYFNNVTQHRNHHRHEQEPSGDDQRRSQSIRHT